MKAKFSILVSMKKQEQTNLLLDGFEGPIDFLLHLVKKNEIDIYGVTLKKVVDQFLQSIESFKEENLDDSAEFINDTAALLWIKSKTLLPSHDQVTFNEELDPDPKFEIIHQLVDYCKFRDAAKTLSSIEHEQRGFFVRGTTHVIPSVPLGIEHLSLDDIALFFREALKKTSFEIGQINEEIWRVSDKIKWIKEKIKFQEALLLIDLFLSSKGRMEMIVTFLALLELMKMEWIRVIKEVDTGNIIVTKGTQHG